MSQLQSLFSSIASAMRLRQTHKSFDICVIATSHHDTIENVIQQTLRDARTLYDKQRFSFASNLAKMDTLRTSTIFKSNLFSRSRQSASSSCATKMTSTKTLQPLTKKYNSEPLKSDKESNTSGYVDVLSGSLYKDKTLYNSSTLLIDLPISRDKLAVDDITTCTRVKFPTL